MGRGSKKICIGGSEVGTACGLHKRILPHSLYQKITEQSKGTWVEDDEISDPCAHGNKCEPIIAELYQKITGNRVEKAKYCVHEDETMAIMFGCEPDGKVFIGDKFEGLLEIKAPYDILYEDVQPDHMCQIQYEMWITKKPWCDYIAAILPHDNPETCMQPKILLKRVYYSKKYVEEFMIPRLFYFEKCLIEQTEPSKDYYTCLDIPVPISEDLLLSYC